MKKILISFLILCSLSDLLFAQDTITVYYDNNWVETSNINEAAFYRKYFIGINKECEVRDYYISNKIQMTGTYKSKKMTTRNGHFVYYHENGNKSSEGNYVDNKAEGLWSYWLENGQKKSAGEYSADNLEGVWEYWYENGEKKSEGKYLSGEKTGIWNYWYTSGKIKSTETYTKAGSFAFEGFHENGVMSAKGNCVNGLPQGMWMYWNSDGRLNLKGNFNHGLREGEWVRIFPEGELKIFFKDGIKEGKELGGVVRNK
jgi:uncharacterized protein